MKTAIKAPRHNPKQAVDTAHTIISFLQRIERKIDSIKAQTTTAQKEYLTTVEACQYLGCTRALVWKLANAGTITRLKKENGRTYYPQAELKAYIERGDFQPDENLNTTPSDAE